MMMENSKRGVKKQGENPQEKILLPSVITAPHSCHAGGIFFVLKHGAKLKKITTKIAFVVDPSRSACSALPVPEGYARRARLQNTTTKHIFIMMSVQTDIGILPGWQFFTLADKLLFQFSA